MLCFQLLLYKKIYTRTKSKEEIFFFSAIKELAAAGIWNSITKLSQILLDGLDLLLSNLFINGLMTGNVSIAKTIPSLYTSLVAMLSDSFYPEFLENYSKNRKEELLKNIKQSINILSMISGICLSMLLVYAKDFYMLWLPDNDANLLRNLTILGTGTVLISGCVYSLFSVFSLTNKVKANSMVCCNRNFKHSNDIFMFEIYKFRCICHSRCKFNIWNCTKLNIYTNICSEMFEL